jgi:hypothetical protein
MTHSDLPVAMCTQPDCAGEAACPAITPGTGALGCSVTWDLAITGIPESRADEIMCARLAQALAGSGTTADTGTRRFIPAGTPFVVHKVTEEADDAFPLGRWCYSARYCGSIPRATLLADAPAFDAAEAKAREARVIVPWP